MDTMFAQRLRLARLRRGLTKKELADLATIQLGSLHLYEAATRYPKRETIYKLAETLHVSPNYLVGLDDGHLHPITPGVSHYHRIEPESLLRFCAFLDSIGFSEAEKKLHQYLRVELFFTGVTYQLVVTSHPGEPQPLLFEEDT